MIPSPVTMSHDIYEIYTEMWIVIFPCLSLEVQQDLLPPLWYPLKDSCLSALLPHELSSKAFHPCPHSLPPPSQNTPPQQIDSRKLHKSFLNSVVFYSNVSMFTLTVPLISPRSLTFSNSVLYSYNTEENTCCFLIKAPSYLPKYKLII